MRYALPVKIARLHAVAQRLNGGWLQILDSTGVRLAEFKLETQAADVLSDVLRFNGFPKFAMAERSGTASSVVLLGAGGALIADQMTVATEKADVIMLNVEVSADNIVRLDSAEIQHA